MVASPLSVEVVHKSYANRKVLEENHPHQDIARSD